MPKANTNDPRSDEEKLIAFQVARRSGVMVSIELPGAELSGIELPGADLSGANLRGADLSAAVLAGAHLSGADLRDAILVGVNLSGADLTDADLRGADVAGAQVDDAVFAHARLEGACISEWLGEPLSLTAAVMDRMTVQRSEMTMRQIAQMVVRGADVDEKEDSPWSQMPLRRRSAASRAAATWDEDPASLADPISSTDFLISLLPAPRSPSLLPSILPMLRQAEAQAQKQRAQLEREEGPISFRRHQRLGSLISMARAESQTISLHPQAPMVAEMQSGALAFPQPGETYLGVKISHALIPGTTSRCFSGTTKTGERALVRIFDPYCDGAALQLPAFQRGLRALSRAQELHPGSVARLLTVAVDQTSFVTCELPGVSLHESEGQRMDPAEATRAVLNLAECIATFHRQGLHVRSLKPSNLFFVRGSLVLSEIDAVHLPTLGQFRGDVAGYAAYAAPEEIVGLGTRHPTSDVYCLGKLLEFLLSGEEPLGGPPGIGDSEASDGLPCGLVTVLRRAGAENPTERFQSAMEFHAALSQAARDSLPD